MIEDTDKIYSMTALIKEARKDCFPFRSRITIRKLAEKKKLPAHYTKIGKHYKNWWFIGRELHEWMRNSKSGK